VPTPRPSAQAEIRTGPHAVPIGHGWDWIGRGFWHFKANPWAWILLTICYLVIAMALSLIPIVGALAAYLVMPIFTAGLMLGARAQDQRESLRFGHLFAGFSSQPGQLLAAGALYLLGIGVATIPAVLLLGAPLFLDMAGMDPGQLGQAPRLMADRMEDILTFPTLLLAALVVTLLALPVVMAYWFSPALIAIDGMRAWPAMKLSFKGCLRNILPFLLYGVAGLFLVILGSLPMFLGLLVVLPVLTASIYAAYRDIFHNRSGVG
jgi:uncharacterized membrane protein